MHALFSTDSVKFLLDAIKYQIPSCAQAISLEVFSSFLTSSLFFFDQEKITFPPFPL